MKKSRIIALLSVTLLLVSLFAGCGGSAAEATPSPVQSAVPAASSAPADTAAPQTPAQITLPITDEKTEISDWKTMQTLAGVITDWNEAAGYIELEKRTNIHVNFLMPGMGNEQENFNILMASNDYPDIIEFFSAYYTNGIDNAIENNIAIRLNEVIDQYMPNYKALISDPVRKLKTMTDSGNIGSLYCIYDAEQYPWTGLIVRKDWLDDLGLEIPRTYDDWYHVLTAFKTEKGATNPMLLSPSGDTAFGNNWVGGFGTITGMLQKNGTVYYGPLLPEYRTYLETFSKWYSEGLIDRDFTTRTNPFDVSLSYSNAAGVWQWFSGGTYETLSKQPQDPGFVSVAVQSPVLNAGETAHFRVTGDDVGIGAAISASCQNVEIVARWLDYCYSEEGSLYLNYGIEGETFYFDEAGLPTLDAAGMEKKYNMPYAQCLQASGPIEAPYLRNMYKNSPIRKSSVPQSEESYESIETWNKDLQDWMIPTFITQTADESTEYAAIFNDINTYVNETIIAIIIGAKPISAYDDMTAQIKKMGIDRCVEIKQAAVTRYFERSK